MRIRATCHHCERGFLFTELRWGRPEAADRCPSCSRHLDLRVGDIAQRAESALAVLVETLRTVSAGAASFHVHPESVLTEVLGVEHWIVPNPPGRGGIPSGPSVASSAAGASPDDARARPAPAGSTTFAGPDPAVTTLRNVKRSPDDASQRNVFLCQARLTGPDTLDAWPIAAWWFGRAPGSGTERLWRITKVRVRGQVMKMWGVPAVSSAKPETPPTPEPRTGPPVTGESGEPAGGVELTQHRRGTV